MIRAVTKCWYTNRHFATALIMLWKNFIKHNVSSK